MINLRESQKFNLYATKRVLDVLGKNSIFNVLNPKFVNRIPVELNNSQTYDTENNFTGITVFPFVVPGKVALWMEDERGKNFGSVEEDTIVLEVSDANSYFIIFLLVQVSLIGC